MKNTTETNALKSNKGTKKFRLAALVAGCSVAAVIGFAMMNSNKPVVAGHAYTSENKVAVAASDKKTLKAEEKTPEQPANSAIASDADPKEESVVESTSVEPSTPAQQNAPVEATASVHEETSMAQTAFEEFEEVEPDYAPAPTAVPVEQSVADQMTAAQDNVWHITYIPAWGAGSAPEDGSIGIWADGWFIAHSGMANGDKIASLPQYVEVDGQVYTMTDTWVSDDNVSTDEIARARANNGIVFQTCITDTTNRMVHYEPVNGTGYAYNFSSYPYTAHDGEIFGY